MSAYLKPATPLPWTLDVYHGADNKRFALHAANAFPHLVGALEAALDEPDRCRDVMRRALAIARGEVKP
jgi:hypothetical protein